MPDFRHLSWNQALACGFVVVFVLSFFFRPIRRWWRNNFDYLPEFFMGVQAQFISVFWGESIVTGFGHLFGVAMPFLILAVYSQFKTPEPVVNWAAIGCAVLIAGYYVWRSDHVRLQQRINVVGLNPRNWFDPQVQRNARAFDIEIVNGSEATTIHGVRVQLSEIVPTVQNLDWLPVLFQQKHDNPILGVPHVPLKEFDLNATEHKQIDLVSAFEDATGFTVHHIAGGGVNTWVDFNGVHRLRITITARDLPPLNVWVGVSTEGGFIKCELGQVKAENLNQKNSMQ